MGQPTEGTAPESLTVRDNRTGKVYNIPCVPLPHPHLICYLSTKSVWISIENNSIPATAFKNIRAPRKAGEREENETERGLRVADKGFLNTAVITSEITYIDGEAGGASPSFFITIASN